MNIKKINISKKEVMQTAWYFMRHEAVTMSEALKKAWLNVKCKVAMCCKVVSFTFKKVDGTLRQAHGTLNIEMHTAGTGKHNDAVQVYYDTDKQAFRSFRKFNLVTF